MGVCSSKVVEVTENGTKAAVALDNDRQIQENMHAVRLARLETEKAAVAHTALVDIHLKETTMSPEEIAKAVSPTATLPTVQKRYAPNVYPFPPIREPPAEVPQESSKPAPPNGIWTSFKGLFGGAKPADGTAGAA